MGTELLFRLLVRAMTCRHVAVDGDICCNCKFRVDRDEERSRYVLSDDQSAAIHGGALAFLEDNADG